MKKRPKRKTAKPPPERTGASPRRSGRTASPRSAGASSRRPGAGRQAAVRQPGTLQYKVVELSTVDEGSLERVLNLHVHQGWNLDGIQFAMREASKRPAMAFVFFTREGPPADAEAEAAGRSGEEAREHLTRLAQGAPEDTAPAEYVPAVDPYARLRQLAGEDDTST